MSTAMATASITVLDASAVIAFLQGEPGAEQVRKALTQGNCAVTAANQAEIVSKALDRGLDAATIEAILAELSYEVIDSTAQDGMQAGWMRTSTRSVGLSLGDRLCLAAAQRLKAIVLTADRPWVSVAKGLQLKVVCIRPVGH